MRWLTGNLEIAEPPLVCQIHLSWHRAHLQSRCLCVHLKIHGLSRLDPYDELVPADVAEDAVGDVLVLNSNLGLLLIQRLARLHDEGDALPARRIDVHQDAGECRRYAVFRDRLVVLVAWLSIRGCVLPDQTVPYFYWIDISEHLDLCGMKGVSASILNKFMSQRAEGEVFTFSSLMSSDEKETGRSIVRIERTCRRSLQNAPDIIRTSGFFPQVFVEDV